MKNTKDYLVCWRLYIRTQDNDESIQKETKILAENWLIVVDHADESPKDVFETDLVHPKELNLDHKAILFTYQFPWVSFKKDKRELYLIEQEGKMMKIKQGRRVLFSNEFLLRKKARRQIEITIEYDSSKENSIGFSSGYHDFWEQNIRFVLNDRIISHLFETKTLFVVGEGIGDILVDIKGTSKIPRENAEEVFVSHQMPILVRYEHLNNFGLIAAAQHLPLLPPQTEQEQTQLKKLKEQQPSISLTDSSITLLDQKWFQFPFFSIKDTVQKIEFNLTSAMVNTLNDMIAGWFFIILQPMFAGLKVRKPNLTLSFQDYGAVLLLLSWAWARRRDGGLTRERTTW